MPTIPPTPTTTPYPEAANLQTGDILWPRHPDVLAVTGDGQIAQLKEQAREAVVHISDKIKKAPAFQMAQKWIDGKADDDFELREQLKDLLYTLYAMASSSVVTLASPGSILRELNEWLPNLRTAPGEATFVGLYVGHVSMVERDKMNRLWVIESTYRLNGVRMLPYDDWLSGRRAVGAHVWHGRLPNLDDGKRSAMIREAHRLRMLGKQYAIFDTRIEGRRLLHQIFSGDVVSIGDGRKDEEYVYCAELIWRAAKKVGVDLDSRTPEARRRFRFLGPRALYRSHIYDELVILNKPGGLDF